MVADPDCKISSFLGFVGFSSNSSESEPFDFGKCSTSDKFVSSVKNKAFRESKAAIALATEFSSWMLLALDKAVTSGGVVAKPFSKSSEPLASKKNFLPKIMTATRAKIIRPRFKSFLVANFSPCDS